MTLPRMNKPLARRRCERCATTRRIRYDIMQNIPCRTFTTPPRAPGDAITIYSLFQQPVASTRWENSKSVTSYDADGNMIRMPHLPVMDWGFKNQLHVTREQVVRHGNGQGRFMSSIPAATRVRKVTEWPDGSRAHERIYLGGFEMYRKYSRTQIVLNGKR